HDVEVVAVVQRHIRFRIRCVRQQRLVWLPAGCLEPNRDEPLCDDPLQFGLVGSNLWSSGSPTNRTLASESLSCRIRAGPSSNGAGGPTPPPALRTPHMVSAVSMLLGINTAILSPFTMPRRITLLATRFTRELNSRHVIRRVPHTIA